MAIALACALGGANPVAAQSAFITTWETTSSNESITIPTEGNVVTTDYDFQIDWGDGTTEQITGDDPDPSHEYASAGTYQVEITTDGSGEAFPRIFLNASFRDDNAQRLKSIDQWGSIQWESMEAAFQGAQNMTYSATDAPDLSNVISMARMFADAFNFDGDISSWDTGNVTDMSRMFENAGNFNGDISSWSTGSVTDMSRMFQFADSFNQPIGEWDTGKVTDMEGMFRSARTFNQPVGSWEVGEVTTMKDMFNGAANFNQDINSWDVSSVTTMERMFNQAERFNQPVGSWATGSVTSMRRMFRFAEGFNQPIGEWDVSSVTSMNAMFADAIAFDQDISSWKVSSVTDMAFMFTDATSFNQSIEEWDVSSTTDLSGMFSGASRFNQPLGRWDVSMVTDMTEMLDESGISSINYDRTLIGWSRLDLDEDITVSVSGVEYCDAGPFRTHLQNEFNWTFSGDTLISGCPLDLVSSGNGNVGSDGAVSFTSGIDISFNGTNGSGRVTVGRFSDSPRNVSGISESNVSEYRVVVVAGPGLSFDNTTEVRFKAGEFPGISAPSDVTVYSRPIPGNGSFSALTTSYDSGTDEIVAETGSFSELVFASGSNTLPVELARFEGTVVDAKDGGAAGTSVRLTWQTVSETGNAGFEVQRQIGKATSDGTAGGNVGWQQVGFRESQAPGSTTSETLTYRFTDKTVPYSADSVSYRLRQVDTDGSATLTDPITVGRSGPGKLQLLGTAPNPARRQVTVRYGIPESTADARVRMRLYDVLGRQVRSVEVQAKSGRHRETLDVSGLSSGTYVLRIQAGGQKATRKLTVVK